jgi:glyoxylase-like metal-dependent hydrolase (beta-lactamase superfamily II)
VSDHIRLYMVDGGQIYLPRRNIVMRAENGNEMVTTPVIWFVITHPRGNVVIDGGNAAEVAEDAVKHWGAITKTSTPLFTAEQAVLPSLKRIGIEPASVRWILQSHLHLDHTGAVAAIESFPNAQVLATRTEYEFAHAPASYSALGYCRADYVKDGVDWVLLDNTDDGYDLFGDGTIRCWRTPGHSPGHQSFEVSLPSGTSYILAFDAADTIAQLMEHEIPGTLTDAVQVQQSVRKLRRLAWRSQATVIAGHDAEQWATLRHAPEYYD